MSFYIEGYIIGLLGYAPLGKCVWEHDGGTMSGAAVLPEWITWVRGYIAQLAAQARHNRAFIIFQRERLCARLLFDGRGGVSDSLLHKDFLQLHLHIVGWRSPDSSSHLLRQVELGFGVPR